MRESGPYATYRGKTCRVYSVGDTTVNLPCDLARLEAGEFPDEIAREPGRDPRWVKVPTRSLDRFENVLVRATWRGQEVSVEKLLDPDHVAVRFGGSPAFARENGLEGDQYMGWGGTVAVDELTDVTEDIRELAR